jgi:hypothetical protein
MLFKERDEIGRRLASQRRLGKVRVRREEILGPAMDVREIAASAAGNENLLAETVGVFKNGDAASTPTGLDCTHQAGCATSENQCVETIGHDGVHGYRGG